MLSTTLNIPAPRTNITLTVLQCSGLVHQKSGSTGDRISSKYLYINNYIKMPEKKQIICIPSMLISLSWKNRVVKTGNSSTVDIGVNFIQTECKTLAGLEIYLHCPREAECDSQTVKLYNITA
jgi:hypothetical protein